MPDRSGGTQGCQLITDVIRTWHGFHYNGEQAGAKIHVLTENVRAGEPNHRQFHQIAGMPDQNNF